MIMRPVIAVAILAAAMTSGCVTREDIRGIQTDLYGIQQRLESKTDSVQTSQADIAIEMKELSTDLNALQTELQDNRDRTERLTARLDDLEASLTARMDAQIELLSGSKFVESPLPSTVFNLANSDFSRGKYNEAVRGFQDYLKKFPKGDKLVEAKLKIADSQMRLKNTSDALKAYDDLIKDHPKDSLAATAMLRKGEALEASGQTATAKEVYANIVKQFPNRPEAQAAQEKFRNLQTPPAP